MTECGRFCVYTVVSESSIGTLLTFNEGKNDKEVTLMVTTSIVKLEAPKGKTRIVCTTIDPVKHMWTCYVLKDIDSTKEAIRIVNDHNTARKNEADDKYYAYSDQGKMLCK